MKPNRFLSTVLAALTMLVMIPAMAAAQAPVDESIVDVLEDRGDFTILLDALETAEFREALETDGPFTLFAPTDEAFEALPEGELEEYLANPDALAGLLGVHLASGELNANWLARYDTVDTVMGEPLRLTRDGAHVRVNGALVTETGLLADNGLIHVVDQVIKLH